MGREIERKFLVLNDAWRSRATSSVCIRQAYLVTGAGTTVRLRVVGSKALLTIKGTSGDSLVSRLEFEYGIPLPDAEVMIERLCAGRVITKTRHEVPVGSHVFEVDVFEGESRGLIVAEVELAAEDEVFDRPAWLGDEVSDDPRYLNAHLVSKPFTSW